MSVTQTNRSVDKRLRGGAAVKRRARWLQWHPLCVRCEAMNKGTRGTVVDHVIALVNGGVDDESNLQTLCHPCHEVKTAEDMGYQQHRRVAIGLDGYPVDKSIS